MSEKAGQTSTEIRSTIRRGDVKYTLLAAGVLLMIVGLSSGASTLLELYRDAWPSPSRACEDFQPPEVATGRLGYASGGPSAGSQWVFVAIFRATNSGLVVPR